MSFRTHCLVTQIIFSALLSEQNTVNVWVELKMELWDYGVWSYTEVQYLTLALCSWFKLQIFSAWIYGPSAKHTGYEFEREKQGSITYSADLENKVHKIYCIRLRIYESHIFELWIKTNKYCPSSAHHCKDHFHSYTVSLCSSREGRLFNPLNPKSYLHLISPYNITSETHINVTRIKEMITN